MRIITFLIELFFLEVIKSTTKYLDSVQTGKFAPSTLVLDCSINSNSNSNNFTWTKQYGRQFKHSPQVFLAMHYLNNCDHNFWYESFEIVLWNKIEMDLIMELHYHTCDYGYVLGISYFAVDMVQNKNIEGNYLYFNYSSATIERQLNFSREIDDKTVVRCFLMDISQHIGFTGAYFKSDVSVVKNNKKASCKFDSTAKISSDDLKFLTIIGIAIFPIPQVLILQGAYKPNRTFITNIPFDLSQTTNIFFIGAISISVTNKLCINIGLDTSLLKLDLSTDYGNTQSWYCFFMIIELDNKCPISLPINSKIALQIPGIDFTFKPSNIYSQKKAITQYSATHTFYLQIFKIYQTMEIEMILDVFNRIIHLKIHGCNSAHIESFSVNDRRVEKKYVSIVDGKAVVTFGFEDSLVGEEWKLFYTHKYSGTTSYFIVKIPKISNISCSMKNTECSLQLSHLSQTNEKTNEEFFWQQNALVQNGTFNPADSNNILKTTFHRLPEAQQSLLKFNRTQNNSVPMLVLVKIIAIKGIQHHINESKAKMLLTGTPLFSNYLRTEFECNSGITVESAIPSNNAIELFLDLSNHTIGDEFYIKYVPQLSPSLQFFVRNVNLFPPQILTSKSSDEFQISLKNLLQLPSSSSLALLSFNSISTSFQTVSASDNQILINLKLKKYICEPQPFNISFNITQSPSYSYSINMMIDKVSFSAGLWIQIIWMMSIILSSLYLIVFILSIFACKKLYAVQLIFIIHLACYSMILVGIYCEPFGTLDGLKYSIGYNPLFQNLQQIGLINNYKGINIVSNFLSNLNLMIVPLFIVPLLYYPLKVIGEKSEDYTTSPRCLKYGQSLLFEVPLTILLFNSFNIYSSLVVNIQSFGWSNVSALFSSLVFSLMLPTYIFIYLKFNAKFSQFKVQFNEFGKIFNLSRQQTYEIRKKYVIVLIVQMILIPIFLSIKYLFKYSLYIVLLIEILVTIFVIIVRLYSTSSTNFRSYLHRSIILLIISFQIFSMTQKPEMTFESTFYLWYPSILLLLLFFGFCCTGIYAIHECILFFKSPKLINNSMKLKKTTTLIKPENPNNLPHSGIWIERNQYVVYKKQRQRLNNPLLTQSTSRHTQPSQKTTTTDKVQKWFQQIQEYNLFNQLGVIKNIYENISNSSDLRQKIVFEIFSPIVDIYHILKSHPDIINIKDMIQYIDHTQIEMIKQKNQ